MDYWPRPDRDQRLLLTHGLGLRNRVGQPDAVLRAHDITLRFGGVTALAEVNIDLRHNEDLREFCLGLDREYWRKRWLG